MNEIERLQARARRAIGNEEWNAACDIIDEIIEVAAREIKSHCNIQVTGGDQVVDTQLQLSLDLE